MMAIGIFSEYEMEPEPEEPEAEEPMIDDLKAIRERYNRATPFGDVAYTCDMHQSLADIPALLDHVEQLRAKLEDWQKVANRRSTEICRLYKRIAALEAMQQMRQGR
jgi:hypothetical protein